MDDKNNKKTRPPEDLNLSYEKKTFIKFPHELPVFCFLLSIRNC